MKRPYTLPPLLDSLVLAGCANDQIDAMQMCLNQQEQQIRLLNSQLSGVQPTQVDTWAQVQSLRQETSAVKGQIDDFNNVIAVAGDLPGLAQCVNSHKAALQASAMQLGMELPMAAVLGVPGATPGMPDAIAAVPVPATSVMQLQAAAPTPQQVAPQTQTRGGIARALYDNGVQSFNARNYKQALKSFSDFTGTCGKHKLVSSAWFWCGECNYQLGNFPAAALDYEQVVSKYGSSRKAASAYLKQGACLTKAGKKDAVKVRLWRPVKKFPKSPEAIRATQLMKDNRIQEAS